MSKPKKIMETSNSNYAAIQSKSFRFNFDTSCISKHINISALFSVLLHGIIQNKAMNILIKLTISQKALAIKSLLFSVFVSIFEGLSAPLIMLILQKLGGNIANNTPTGNSSVILGIYSSIPISWQFLVLLISFMALTIIKNICLYLSHITTNELQLKIGRAIRKSCIERFFCLDLIFYSTSNLGELISYVNEQSQRSEILSSHIIEMIRELLVISVLLIVLVSLSPLLTVVNVIVIFIGLFLIKTLLKKVQFYGRLVSVSIDNFSTFITESLSGIRVIKSFGTELRELERADSKLQQRYFAEMKAFSYRSAVVPITETVGIAILLIILSVGSFAISNKDNNTLPLLLTYCYTLLRIIPRINQLNSLRSQLALLSGSLESIYNFLSSTEDLNLLDGNKEYSHLTSSIYFDNVSFTFPNNTEPTLKNITFNIKKGSTNALVGSSGSGKSTLVDLVMRFHDPNSGTIKLDGTDLREYKISSWRKSVAIVSQETFLFHSSIRENIAYGCPDASDLEVADAAKKAYAYEFIQDLPQGFETIVGDRGTRLSGGQKQRIAIARAILCDPDILILDEATSALDSTSEKIVQKAIEEVSRDRTVIVIAHRLSTIENADNIIVMNNGRIIEQGYHQQLIELQGNYWSLYKSQTSIIQ
jgi:ABC-type multidrug transport system fused ATPase/permease subunit